jgi:alpha-beta hydrolase superfamily lysophospholipase
MSIDQGIEIRGRRGRITVHRWTAIAPRFVALLAHGYGEHAGRYAHIAKRLVAEGSAVYAPDFEGHGLSEGDRARIQTIDDLVDELASVYEASRRANTGTPVILIGHSLGGLIATRFAQRDQPDLAALVLSGPFVGGNPQVEALLTMDPLPEVPIDPGILSRDPAVGEAYASDELVYHGPFHRETLEAFSLRFAQLEPGPVSATCRRCGSTVKATSLPRWPSPGRLCTACVAATSRSTSTQERSTKCSTRSTRTRCLTT